MLRTSRIHPHLSAYATLEVIHDFNHTPLAPPGTKAIKYEPTETRGTWAPIGSDAWYVGPAKEHYQCYCFYLPASGGYQTSARSTFYPTHCNTPMETPMDRAIRAVKELTNAIKDVQQKTTTHLPQHETAL